MLTKLGERGFVRLDRELTEYPQIYCNPVVFTVYGHCLLNAAYREKHYAGILLHPGQFITSYAAMAKECGITERQARNAFERLEESHLIERKPVGKGRKSGTLVTVANSQFIVIGENEVGLKTSDSELRTYLQQGNYLINNKKKEEEIKKRNTDNNKDWSDVKATSQGEEPLTSDPTSYVTNQEAIRLASFFTENGFKYDGKGGGGLAGFIAMYLNYGYTKKDMLKAFDRLIDAGDKAKIQNHVAYLSTILAAMYENGECDGDIHL